MAAESGHLRGCYVAGVTLCNGNFWKTRAVHTSKAITCGIRDQNDIKLDVAILVYRRRYFWCRYKEGSNWNVCSKSTS